MWPLMGAVLSAILADKCARMLLGADLEVSPQLDLHARISAHRFRLWSSPACGQARGGLVASRTGSAAGDERESCLVTPFSLRAGEREPDHETLAALSDALGVPPAYFHASSDVLAEVILLVARLPPERQQGVLDLIKDHLTSTAPSR